MIAHTPAPWTVGGDDGGWSAEYDGDTDTYASQPVVADTGDTVCLVVCVGWDEREFDANSRLIAAAPELLEALRSMTDWTRSALNCKDWHWDGNQREAAEIELATAIAAIAKAGGQP